MRNKAGGTFLQPLRNSHVHVHVHVTEFARMEAFAQQMAAIQKAAQVAADYEKTLMLLAELKGGRIALEQVQLVPGGWQIVQFVAAEQDKADKAAPPTEHPRPESD